MPIYEYRCTNGHTFDVMQSIGDDPVTKCQECSAQVERVYRAPAVHFKGSGFYNTDYGTRKRSREQKETVDSSSNGSSASGDSTEKKSDAKPAGGEKPAAPAAAKD